MGVSTRRRNMVCKSTRRRERRSPREDMGLLVRGGGGWRRGYGQAGNDLLDPVQKSGLHSLSWGQRLAVRQKQYLRGNGGGCMGSEL